MRLKTLVGSLFLFIVFFAFFSTKSAFADSFTLSGSVSDSSGTSIPGATINVTDVNTNVNAGNTTTDNSGNYNVFLINGTYNVQVTPPAGSTFSSAIAYRQTISANTVLNFVLTPAGTVTINGHVYDSQGNLASGVNVELDTNNGSSLYARTSTDSSGSYSISAATGTYFLKIQGGSNTPNLPQSFEVDAPNYSLTQSTILDVIIPVKKVTVHVEDAGGNPISNVQLLTNPNAFTNGGLSIGGSITNARGGSSYTTSSPHTDASGNAILWLIPNTGGSFTVPYTITATPSSGSAFQTTSLSGITITGDTNLTITMQQLVTLSGHVYDSLGNAASGVTVELDTNNGSNLYARASTDSNGSYSLAVSSGTYFLKVQGGNNTPNLPQSFEVDAPNYSITQNTVLEITVPAKKITVHVQDAGGNPLSDVQLLTNSNAFTNGGLSIGGNITNARGGSSYTSSGPQTDGAGNAVLWLIPNSGGSFTVPYIITATPPSGSNFQTASLSGITITGDTNLTITMQQPVTINGHVYDSQGNLAPGVNVELDTNNGSSLYARTSTDSSGSYSISASTGTYFLKVQGGNNTPDLPQSFEVDVPNYSLTQNIALDFVIPAKKVTVHVQDAGGNPVNNIQLLTNPNAFTNGGLSIGGSITNARGGSSYTTSGPHTDASGNAILWLIPNTGGSFTVPYSIIATPPSGSIYSPFTLNNISISGDQTELISLQYNHATPVTTATLVTQHSDGTYSDPTTVTLSATAASGFTIANTYYTIDGSSQQTYSAPFTVTGNGNHTITYWSVDNSDVQETHNSKTFTIHTNQPPYVNPLSGGAINAGGTYSENGSFSDPDSISWTATVDYGDSAGPVNLPLNPDKTFSLSHQYTVAGAYTVTVVVTDDQGATGTTIATVTVNGPPQISGFSNATINFQDDFIESGSFTDTDSTSWSGTVDYGSGAGPQPLTLNPGKTFTLDYTYPAAGTYTVNVSITDNQGATGTAILTITVNAPPHINPLTGATINEGGTYTETGSFADIDSTSWTGTVNYGDGSSTENLTLNPDNTFNLNHIYKDNGSYTVTILVTDNQGAIGTGTTSITVNNVAPNVSAITASINPIQVNTGTTASATFTDPGVSDSPFTVKWQWGDNQTDTYQISPTDPTTPISLSRSHTYTQAGVYTITLSVTDKDGGLGNAPLYQYLSVYNPTPTGLFSGARIFTSPAGADTANPTVTGQVQFGITAKYDTNNQPTGKVSMNFKTGNIDFSSTGITLLVTSNGMATLRGTGTINGTGNYTFLVTGVDSQQTGGGVVRFQIEDSSGNIVYDTQPGAEDTATSSTTVTGQVIVH